MDEISSYGVIAPDPSADLGPGVYRVKDPAKFFSKLKDAHSFGSEKQELAREKTWLERFHEWKRMEREDEPRRVSLEVMLRGTCDHRRLLDLVENFTLYPSLPKARNRQIVLDVLTLADALDAAPASGERPFRILVTGASGFDGHRAAQQLRLRDAAQHDVLVG